MPTQYYRKGNGSPEVRAKAKSREADKIRRRYKKNLTLSRKFLPGERDHVIDIVVVLRIAGYEKQQIARILNVGLSQIAELLNDPAVSEKLVTLRGALPAAALDLLQDYMILAVQTLVDIMRSAEDDKIVLQAAGRLIVRAGLGKATKSERLQVNENRTVFTDDGIIEQLRKASPEVQEQAAQVIEQLENLLTTASEPKEAEIPE